MPKFYDTCPVDDPDCEGSGLCIHKTVDRSGEGLYTWQDVDDFFPGD